jgi:hypothetical protein
MADISRVQQKLLHNRCEDLRKLTDSLWNDCEELDRSNANLRQELDSHTGSFEFKNAEGRHEAESKYRREAEALEQEYLATFDRLRKEHAERKRECEKRIAGAETKALSGLQGRTEIRIRDEEIRQLQQQLRYFRESKLASQDGNPGC